MLLRWGLLMALVMAAGCGRPDCDRDPVVDGEARTFVEGQLHEVCPGDVLRFRPDGAANADVLLKARGNVGMVVLTKRGRAVPVEEDHRHFRVSLFGSGSVNGELVAGDPHDELEVVLAEDAGQGAVVEVAHVGELYSDVIDADSWGEE